MYSDCIVWNKTIYVLQTQAKNGRQQKIMAEAIVGVDAPVGGKKEYQESDELKVLRTQWQSEE